MYRNPATASAGLWLRTRHDHAAPIRLRLAMTTTIRRTLALVLLIAVALPAFPSAYNARPKLVVIVIVDQFRADLLERYHEQFGPSGFRAFLDRGAVFADCSYNYVNTDTAAG